MPILAFVANKHNLNSIAALTGALEVDARTQALPLQFLWQDERTVSRLRTQGQETDLLIIALSFATANLAEMTALLGDLRELEPAPFVVAGGPHPSALSLIHI